MGPYSCPVVAVQGEASEGNPSGVVVINESDFDAATMTKVALPEAEVQKEAEVPTDTTAPKVIAPWATPT